MDEFDSKTTVAIMIALEEEYETWLRAIDLTPERSIDGYHYFRIRDNGSNRPEYFAVNVVGEMGLVPAVAATDALLSKISPKYLISIGLSGQLSDDCVLGDVVIATDCDLPYSEARDSKNQMNFAGKTFEVPSMKNRFIGIDTSKYLQGREPSVSPSAKKQLINKNLWRKYPNVHFGITCSTDFVVDNPDTKKELLSKNRRFLCTDMESAAMVSAARKRGFLGEIAIIRGISDPADGTKKEIDRLAGAGTMRRYAMHNATLVALHSIIYRHGKKNHRLSNRPIISTFIDRLDTVNRMLSEESTPITEAISNLSDGTDNSSLDKDLAKFVYRARIERSASDVPKPLASEIMSAAPAHAVNYFVALYVMQSLHEKFEDSTDLLTPLTHVYTHDVNKFCKALLECMQIKGKISHAYNRIIIAYTFSSKSKLDPSAKSYLQSHLAYLLGRITDEQHIQLARKSLARWRDKLIRRTGKLNKNTAELAFSIENLEALSRVNLLLFRTIQISLVQLGMSAESDLYITSCMHSKRLDAQNRGFHLEYYRDIPYDPSQPLNNEDRLEPCPRTFEAIGQKLISSFESRKPYPLRDIELYTVISLLKFRLEAGKLSGNDRLRGLEIISKSNWVSTNDQYSMLRDRLLSDLSNPSFKTKVIVEQIFGLKKLKRTGWNARGRNVADPESVASHTFGGLALIELFFPETNSILSKDMGAGYSKEAVMRLFLKHDWAEAIIGDLLPDQKTEEALANEESAFRLLGASFLYSPYLNRSIYEDWREFEKGDTTNANLARDIDHLDNLLQVLIESEIQKSAIPDRNEWIESIKKKIRTPLGRSIFLFLLDAT
jgi:5'-deoxynucleotidase YfbR-like HD superfamily hydrolase/nucleoside phosphorylase